MEATIRANAPVLGMRRGDPPQRVELTPFIEAVAATGKITILQRHPPVESSPIEAQGDEDTPGLDNPAAGQTPGPDGDPADHAADAPDAAGPGPGSAPRGPARSRRHPHHQGS